MAQATLAEQASTARKHAELVLSRINETTRNIERELFGPRDMIEKAGLDGGAPAMVDTSIVANISAATYALEQAEAVLDRFANFIVTEVAAGPATSGVVRSLGDASHARETAAPAVEPRRGY